jgi:hypothetical protein
MDRDSEPKAKRGVSLLLMAIIVGLCVAGGFVAGWYGHAVCNKPVRPLAGPRVQDVMDFLAKRPPDPPGTKWLMTRNISRGYEFGTLRAPQNNVTYEAEFALEIEEPRADFSSALDSYAKHYAQLCRPTAKGGEGGYTLNTKRAGELSTFGENGTWHYLHTASSRFHDLRIEATGADFKPSNEGTGRFVQVHVGATRPTQGRRVMWLRIWFKAKDLTGDGEWPKEP